jgi:tRNA dimethylallyltransferase
VRIAGLWLPRDVTNARISDRFAAMRTGGLVAEVERLRADPRGWSRTARQAIGYKELEGALDAAGPDREAALAEAFDTAVRRTRSFARRQRMWFRRDPRITWFGAAREISDVEPALLAWWGVP